MFAVVCALVSVLSVYWFGMVAVAVAYWVRWGRLDEVGVMGSMMWPVLLFNQLRRG